MESEKTTNSPSNENLVRKMDVSSPLKFKFIAAFIGIIVLGVGTGFIFSQRTGVSTNLGGSSDSARASLDEGDVVGSDDTKLFKDTAEGTLKVGGIDGEGAYHLVREGGPSQNVYLTSSVVDLSAFVDKEIKVWGQTQKARKAGWLMDVGRVEVLE